MNTHDILQVKKDGREFYVLAEPFWPKYRFKHLDSKTKTFMKVEDVKYRLTELKDGKVHGTIGFVSNIEQGTHIIKIRKDCRTINNSTIIIEYTEDMIFIIERVYSF